MDDSKREEALKLKEKGNEAYKVGNWQDAIHLYTKAIALTTNETDLAVCYKNRAAAYLKLEKHERALEDCEKSLEMVPNDPKVLFRRSLALENLERYEEAYVVAQELLKLEPSNKLVQPILKRLHGIVLERVNQNIQTDNKIDTMSKYAFDITLPQEKRETAINNLLVLARNKKLANNLCQKGILDNIKQLVKTEKNKDILISAIRIISELCKSSLEITKNVVKQLGLSWFLVIIDTKDQDQINAVEHCMQALLNSYSGMENKPESKPNAELISKNKAEIDMLLSCLVQAINNRTITGLARDAIIELVTKNIHYDTLNWAEDLIKINGIERLLECASELEELKYESAMNITPSTRTIAAVCLARVYDNMYYDQIRQLYITKVEEFLKEKLLSADIESKVRATVAITSLLRGPLDVGNIIIGKEGILQMVLVMANTDDILQQKVALECVIAAASKQDKAKAIISQGINILKKLYKSSEPAVQVRALVAMCKLASCGGSDASIKLFSEGSNLKLAEACRRILLHSGGDKDIQKWSAEGLSYLTLDAEVKEKLIEDKQALRVLINLAASGDQSVVYGIVTTLVNLCNAYDKQEIAPEMVQLAQFAKQHVPEEHEFEDPDFVTKRILILGHENVASALVSLSKTESTYARELMARVFNALCSEVELRGIVVQQGGVKVLISFTYNGTEKGKKCAAQALARIGITLNPEIAFPGQRSLEVIRPLLSLLHPDCSALENFEALLALCNISQTSESARQRILKEEGLAKIDHYLYEDHAMLLRAAAQVTTNLCMSPDVIKLYEGENDKLKYLVILSADEDLETSLAVSGALAMLTSNSVKCCSKIFDSSTWLDNLQYLVSNANIDLQYRGVYIIANMIKSSKEVAEKVMETTIMELLMAITKLEDDKYQKIQTIANDALKFAENWGIIQKHDGSSTSNSTVATDSSTASTLT